MLARELGGAPENADGSITAVDPPGPTSDWQIDRLIERAKASGMVPPEIGAVEIRRLLQVLSANLKALRRYLRGNYPGRVHLFRAAEKTAFHPDPTFGWGTLAAGGVEVHEVPGDHYSMVREPQVRTLAERIKAGLVESVVRLSAGFGDNAPRAGEGRAIGSAD